MENFPSDVTSLCYICFDTLISNLSKKNKILPFPNEFKGKKCPLFVTWKIGADKILRGCIGTFASGDLETNIPQYAKIAALNDSRFPPIHIKELSDLHVGVSLLINFETVEDPLDWEVGKHGIEIDVELPGSKRTYSGTFLPEVAKEQEWDKTTTLQYLIKKAGCYEKLENVIQYIKLTRYQSIKKSISYKEYSDYIKNI